jgi:superfamily II DNA or RNA helicase
MLYYQYQQNTTMTQLRSSQQRSLEAMLEFDKGQLIKPTGSGKTITMIYDAIREFSNKNSQLIVVVAPRILLVEQLTSEFMEHVTNASVLHVRSGKTHYNSTTQPSQIRKWVENTQGHKLIFTTYDSLEKIVHACVDVNTIYFDEAHNSVKKSFFESTKHFSYFADRCYFFTATPKHSNTNSKPGMNDVDVYGRVIMNVSATELVEKGYILSPKINVQSIDMSRDKEYGAERDCMTLLDTILNEDNMEKVLIAAPNTKVMIRMLAETDFMNEMHSSGYDVLWITAKYGAFINSKKVDRDVFFQTLKEFGKDPNKKFVVLHYSILSEGIDCPGLTACVMMRQMDVIQMCQTIGRVIRLSPDDSDRIKTGELVSGDLDNYSKAFGMIHVPVYSNTGISTARRLESIVDTVFVKGQPAVSVINK